MKSKNTNYKPAKTPAGKQTEIGEIPEGWELTTLGNLADITSSKRIFASDYLSEGVPFYRGKEIVEKNSGSNISSELFISENKFQEIKNKFGVPQENDILLTSVGTLGIPYRVMKDDRFYFKDGNLTWFRNLDKSSSEYIYHWLNSDFGKRRLLEKSIGSTQQALTIVALKSVYIELPPANERSQITSILSSLDEKIELNRRMNKTLEEIGKALFKHWFMDETEEVKKVELQYIVEFNPRETLGKGVEAMYLEMKDLPEQGMWVYSRVSKPYNGGTKFRNGDTLMARITPCLENGKSGFVNFLEDGEVAFGSTEYIVFRPKNKRLEEFVYFLVRDDKFREYAIRSMVGSSGRQRVQTDAVKQYQLSLPSEDVVIRFHNTMQPIIRQIKSNALENEMLSSIKNSLLPRLMSGKLRVKYD